MRQPNSPWATHPISWRANSETPQPTALTHWYGGDYSGDSSVSIGLKTAGIGADPFGGFKGEATPSRDNLAADPVAGPVLLNEVHLDPVTSPEDGADEYIELISTNFGIAGMNGLTLVIADADGATPGVITESIDLSGLSTGTNGLAILGDSYNDNSEYDTLISPETNKEDPQGLTGGDIGPNTALIVLIAKGPPPTLGSDVSAINPADIVDSIGFGTSTNAAIAMVSPGFAPDNLSRVHGDLAANSATAWYGGTLDPAGGDGSINYGSYFGPIRGAASPGRYTHAALPNAAASLVLNEINMNPPGGDNDKEFIELLSTNGQSMSTNGYSILLIDVDGTNTGTVLEMWSLDALATGANGLLLIGPNYAPGTIPWTGDSAPDAGTRLGFPAGMAFDDIGGTTNNGATLVLLVKDFKGRLGDDLDAGTGNPPPEPTTVSSIPCRRPIN